MTISSKIRTIFRGNVSLIDLPREALRRTKAAKRQKQERRQIENINMSPARLVAEFKSLPGFELLTHFRDRPVSFFPLEGTDDRERLAKLQTKLFPAATAELIRSADHIVHESIWELAGLGTFQFNGPNFWRQDPLGGKDWGLAYHADVVIYEENGPDIRVLWELNRFGHSLTLAGSFAVTGDEAYAETFFEHIDGWMSQNPYGRGANWNCAMEVALRAINLLAAFDIFRRSKALTAERLGQLLNLFDQHGRYIVDNNEFSYIATSNHYLADTVGLFWIGTLVPELDHAEQWRASGLSEMLHEMGKQILPDGANFEASTGYHKFVTEMILYSFILARISGAEIDPTSLEGLRRMLKYLRSIMRPDGRMPLIGDSDGSRIIPIVKRDADDAGYLLSVGAVFLNDEGLKLTQIEPEVVWFYGETGLSLLREMGDEVLPGSELFPHAVAYVMHADDLYLHLNGNNCGINGRGSHGHNDALSIEISALGRPFIIDPGTYVYNLDRDERHLFRSTAYHSTVTVDGVEQNTTDAAYPFIMGDEARPAIDKWPKSADVDHVWAEHFGYTRLSDPVHHRRTIDFYRTRRYWIIKDDLTGSGEHEFSFVFHLAPGLEVDELDHTIVKVFDQTGRGLCIRTLGLIDAKREVIPAFVSRNYGHRTRSSILRWTLTAAAPVSAEFLIAPVEPGKKIVSRFGPFRPDNVGK